MFGDGSQTRSFCYVDDLIEGLFRLTMSGEHMPVNIGNPNEMTLLELAERVIALTGADSKVVFEGLPVDDPKVRQPDISKASRCWTGSRGSALDDGLRRTIATLRPSPARSAG